ncbi:MAG TPA: hypothetical protein VH593_15740, partial [Ktedonobacteraceae bacterium]
IFWEKIVMDLRPILLIYEFGIGFPNYLHPLLPGSMCYFAVYDILRVRRVALDCIPGATRKYSEGGTWITQPTWSRKAKGKIACCGKQRSTEDM